MKANAIKAARERLESARACASIIQTSLEPKKLRAEWWAFLLAANGVYSKLEQGAKGSGKSEGWFGRRRHVRRKDPLLRYIHHARHSEEHQLDPTGVGHGIDARNVSGAKIVRNADGEFSGLEIVAGTEATIEIMMPRLKLIAVMDERYKIEFPIPDKHLGISISEPLAKNVVRLAVDYLTEMIDDAEKLVV